MPTACFIALRVVLSKPRALLVHTTFFTSDSSTREASLILNYNHEYLFPRPRVPDPVFQACCPDYDTSKRCAKSPVGNEISFSATTCGGSLSLFRVSNSSGLQIGPASELTLKQRIRHFHLSPICPEWTLRKGYTRSINIEFLR